VGISLGGAITMRLLADRPDLVDHAVVDGTGVIPLFGLPLVKLGLTAMRPFLQTRIVTGTISRALGYPRAARESLYRNFSRMNPQAFVAGIRETLEFREPPGLRAAPNPTLFVAGGREPRATRRSNAMLAAAMWRAEARLAPRLHHGWIANDPDLHCRMVEAWITDAPLPAELIG
jgi:pimeloyl-ACP methyl ester carboxylesterase